MMTMQWARKLQNVRVNNSCQQLHVNVFTGCWSETFPELVELPLLMKTMWYIWKLQNERPSRTSVEIRQLLKHFDWQQHLSWLLCWRGWAGSVSLFVWQQFTDFKNRSWNSLVEWNTARKSRMSTVWYSLCFVWNKQPTVCEWLQSGCSCKLHQHLLL